MIVFCCLIIHISIWTPNASCIALQQTITAALTGNKNKNFCKRGVRSLWLSTMHMSSFGAN